MKDCISHIKELIHKQVSRNRIYEIGVRFSEYNRTYYWTNEQIALYLDLINFDGKNSALSVASSGDHAFNLIEKGISNVDTFDSNKFTEYFVLGFKRALILKYEYLDFCHISSRLRSPEISLEELSEIVYGLIPYMDLKYQIFWKIIIDYNYKIQIEHKTNLNLFLMLSIDLFHRSISQFVFNSYLKDEESYNKFKKNLVNANITFKYANALNLHNEFNKKYDVILLSNILDYFDKVFGSDWTYDKLLNYEENLTKLLNDEGVIFLHYVMAYLKDGERFRREIIINSDITPADLTNEEIKTLSSSDGIGNAIILKRAINLQK